MFARLKFDNLIGSSLANVGLSTDEALEFWPKGRTKIWLKEGKKMRWPPVDCAMRSLFALVSERVGRNELPKASALLIYCACLETGEALKAESDTVTELRATIVW